MFYLHNNHDNDVNHSLRHNLIHDTFSKNSKKQESQGRGKGECYVYKTQPKPLRNLAPTTKNQVFKICKHISCQDHQPFHNPRYPSTKLVNQKIRQEVRKCLTCKWVLELKGSFSFAWILRDFEYLREVSIFLEKNRPKVNHFQSPKTKTSPKVSHCKSSPRVTNILLQLQTHIKACIHVGALYL